MSNIIKTLRSHNRAIRFIILAIILIYLGIFTKRRLILPQNEPVQRQRGVIVTLIRSNNKSIFLTINMINSVLKFHPTNGSYLYPFLIFHDQNFTSSLREQMLSCLLKSNKNIKISFAVANFETKAQVDNGSRLEKQIGYRLMCQFWTYDVYYHPAIIKGRYDYLMRMDDDSYFSDDIKKDLFLYMDSQKLDYMYRSIYSEPSSPMDPILQRHVKGSQTIFSCLYNNFFMIRLKWFYESKQVQSFLRDLIKDDLMVRQYIGDGCAQAAMLKVDSQIKVEQNNDIPYGHNYHIMPRGSGGWMFNPVQELQQNLYSLCQTLTIIQDFRRRCIYIFIILYLIIWFTISQYHPLSIPTTQLDLFLTLTPCGRLIRYPNVTLTTDELTQLNNEASSFFSFPKDCSLFVHRIPSSSEESTYPLAFTILVHSNLDQFYFLLRTIYRSYHYYCIHVDLKSPFPFYEAIIDRIKCVTNIFVPERRVNVTWGQFSVLEAEHLCQKALLEESNEWKYYFNLANSDIPLKTNAELVQILKLYNQQNDITSLPYHSLFRQTNSLFNRTIPSSIPLPFYKGEFHVLLTRSAVEYIHTDLRVTDLYNYLNGTTVPDEHYYSMINRWKETPGSYPYDHDLSQITFMTRYKIWADRPESDLCQGGFVRGICVFNYQDLWHLATSPHFFANKAFFQRDRIVPYCMAQYLDIRNNIKQEESTFPIIDKEFYKQLKNVQYGKEKLLK